MTVTDRFLATGERPIVIEGRSYDRGYVSVRVMPRADGEADAEVFALMAAGPPLCAGERLADVHVLTTGGGYVFPELRVVSAERTDLGSTFDAVNRGPFFEWDFDARSAKRCGA